MPCRCPTKPDTPPAPRRPARSSLAGAARRRGPDGATPPSRTLYNDGPTGRYLMDGDVAVPPRRRQPGPQAAACTADATRAGWARRRSRTRGTPATTRRARCAAASAGTARTSAASTQRALRLGACASSRSTTARACGSTASRRHEPRRLHAVRAAPPRGAQAGRHQPARHPRRQHAARPTDFPPSGLTDRRCRPAAGGTTAGCCARSTSSASTGWTGRPCGVVPRLRPTSVQVRAHRPEREGVGRARPHHRPLRLETRSTSAASTLSGGGTRSLTTSHPGARRETVDAVAAVPLPGQAHRLGGRAQGQQLPAARPHRGRSASRATAACCSTASACPPTRRRRARGVPGRRASRSTTRSAAGSCPRSRRWARR